MKIKVRNYLVLLPILRKGGVHGKSKKAQRTFDKVSMAKEMGRFVDKVQLK